MVRKLAVSVCCGGVTQIASGIYRNIGSSNLTIVSSSNSSFIGEAEPPASIPRFG